MANIKAKPKKGAFGRIIPEVLKPRLAQLAKEYGGVTRLAAALGISQSTISKLMYTDTPVSDKVADAVVALTGGKLSFKVLKKMHICK